MTFNNPENIYFLLVLPFYFLLLLYSHFEKKKVLNKIAHPKILDKITRGISHKKRRIKYGILVGAFTFLSLAMMRPQWGTKLVNLERSGIDILFVIDVSRSMLAEDIKPNRLEKAKIQLSAFMDKLNGDRVGLVVFAGSAFVTCPLTLDYNALKLLIDQISVNMIKRQGTHLGNALKTARTCFDPIERKYKAIVILTDGEDHGDAPIDEAKECAKEGIKIYSIGIGKPEGEPIPEHNANGEVIGYLKDAQGEIVMSRLDENTLRKVALETKGKYVFSQYGELELNKIYLDLQQMEKKKLESKKLRQKEDKFQYFLMMVLILLLIEFFLNERKKINIIPDKGRYE